MLRMHTHPTPVCRMPENLNAGVGHASSVLGAPPYSILLTCTIGRPQKDVHALRPSVSPPTLARPVTHLHLLPLLQGSTMNAEEAAHEGGHGVASSVPACAPAVPSAFGVATPLPWVAQLQACPVFHPSQDELADPVSYVSSIQERVAHAGIAKLVPPAAPVSTCLDALRPCKLPLVQQLVRSTPGTEWQSPCAWQAPARTVATFNKVADGLPAKLFKSTLQAPPQTIEVRCCYTRC